MPRRPNIAGAVLERRKRQQAKAPTNPIVESPARNGQPIERASTKSSPAGLSPAPAKDAPKSMTGSSARAMPVAQATSATPAPDLLTLRTLAATLDDLEQLRIEVSNRIGAAERELNEPLPHIRHALEPIAAAEHLAELELKRIWRKHPLAPWAKQIPGCGEKLIARLIAEIGDPGARPNPAKLWAYCGVGDPRRKRRAGMSQEEAFRLGNPRAKKAVWKLAYQFMRTVGDEGNRPRSPYRDVYEQRREQTKDRVHESPCVRCGPSGKPAARGSEWSDAHKHADALRIVGKQFLLDLWKEARA